MPRRNRQGLPLLRCEPHVVVEIVKKRCFSGSAWGRRRRLFGIGLVMWACLRLIDGMLSLKADSVKMQVSVKRKGTNENIIARKANLNHRSNRKETQTNRTNHKTILNINPESQYPRSFGIVVLLYPF